MQIAARDTADLSGLLARMDQVMDLARPQAPAAGLQPPAGMDPARVKKTAEEFEAIFARMVLGSCLPEDSGGAFGSGREAGFLRGMMVDQVGGALARRRSLGIAAVVERALTQGAMEAKE